MERASAEAKPVDSSLGSTSQGAVSIDLDALLCALVLAPSTFSRNRFFGLFTDKDARRVRTRAAELRMIVRKLVGRRGPRGRVVDEQVRPDGSVLLKYAVDEIGFTHTALLDPIEASAMRFALHRATEGKFVLLAADKARVEGALARLAPEMRPADAPAVP